MCERRSIRVRCHESPHVEAVGSCLRAFHTVSLERVMNLGENRIGKRILRLARSPAVPRFPHSQAIPDRVHNSLYAQGAGDDREAGPVVRAGHGCLRRASGVSQFWLTG